jgi:signal transduction histidine kinase
MRTRPLSLLMRPTPPPVAPGIAVAVAFIALETLVVYPLREVASEIALGGIYLPGVLVVSTIWGMALGTATAVVSTAAYDYFHVPPAMSLVPADPQGPVELAILLSVAVLLSSIAGLARGRAIEVDERRGEADLASAMARVLLRTADLRSALPGVSQRLARALGLPVAAIELEAVAGDERRAAFPLSDGATRLGTLVVPAGLPRATEERLRERVVPSVEALLRAAREREAMRSALETSREQLRVLAEEQAALRRVATLVARGAPPDEVFAAVVEEVRRVLPAELVAMARYESDSAMTVIATAGPVGDRFPVGGRWALGGKNLSTMVAQTGRPARIDGYADASGPVGVAVSEEGMSSSAGTPIVVEGRLWGVMTVSSRAEHPLPADTEARLASFTELVATAIANAESRAALAASRARIVAASDETRRQIERDLHDGIQQRLVSLGLNLRLAESAVPADARDTIAWAARELDGVTEELREISRGIHPAILSEGGLGPALRTLARRAAIPMAFGGLVDQRFPEPIEVAAYYVVCEALANATKHARASRIDVEATVREGSLHLSVRDDGVGGADSSRGSGLVGLYDRVEALGGTIALESPEGVGTSVAVVLPVAAM